MTLAPPRTPTCFPSSPSFTAIAINIAAAASSSSPFQLSGTSRASSLFSTPPQLLGSSSLASLNSPSTSFNIPSLLCCIPSNIWNSPSRFCNRSSRFCSSSPSSAHTCDTPSNSPSQLLGYPSRFCNRLPAQQLKTVSTNNSPILLAARLPTFHLDSHSPTRACLSFVGNSWVADKSRGSPSILGKRVSDTVMVSCSGLDVVEAPEAMYEEMSSVSKSSRTPVLLFDVMGTIVRDPFYDDVPAFFGISMKELLAIKHPTAWIEFEKGLITEEELVTKFFSDGRDFDSSGLKDCMASGYTYIKGVEALLDRLKLRGYQMHAFTNYPSWYMMIEEKLKLSKYLPWTFVSCHTGRRKPDPEAYLEAAKQLELSPSDLIFIDDQSRNVEAASQIGMTGLVFQGADKLAKDLLTLGIIF